MKKKRNPTTSRPRHTDSPPPPTELPGNVRQASYTIGAVIGVLTLCVYLTALRNGFVNWDDGMYVFENQHIRHLDFGFFRWALFDAGTVYWHPLTWISHALDYAVWGLNPFGHHLTSILLHALNTFMVVILGHNLLTLHAHTTGSPLTSDSRTRLVAAGAVGILFGLHPIHVESAAWVAERKDLLYSLFYLLSIISYLKYADNQERNPRWLSDRRYQLSLLWFFLALCSKPMAVTLPFVLLLLDWYPCRRKLSGTSMVRLILEKVPFLACSSIVSIVTIIAQRSVGALATLDEAPVPVRMLVALKSLMVYLWNMAVPVKLLPLYPFPQDISIMQPVYMGAVLFVLFVTVLCLRLAVKQPVFAAAWGYYVITVFPVLGLLQAGPQAMADRFVYLPSLGPFLLVGLLCARAWKWTGEATPASKPFRILFPVTAALVTVLLACGTIRQIGIWKNGLTLWSCIIDSEPGRFPEAYYLRSGVYASLNDADHALADLNMALTINPKYGSAYVNRGLLKLNRNLINDAIADFNGAIAVNPKNVDAYTDRGNAYFKGGELSRAIQDYTVAIDTNPEGYAAYLNRGVVYNQQGKTDEAIADYNKAASLNPNFANIYLDRGDLYLKTGNEELARRDYQKACTLGSQTGCIKALLPPQQQNKTLG